MTNINIAINGLGRIGKLLLRELIDRDMNVSLVNEVKGDAAINSELIEHDSVHGKWKRNIAANKNTITIDKKNIIFSNEPDLEKINLKNIDLMIDCTGKNNNYKSLVKYLSNGAKKVLVSAPIKDKNILNLVYGVNHELYDKNKHFIVTGASCTTNCLAPIVKVVHENLHIIRGSMTTIHNVTNSQTIIDNPSNDLRRSRSSMTNLIPTTTGSAKAINLIYPELEGKLNGHSIRVPVINASLTDCVFEVKEKTTKEDLNKLFKLYSENQLRGILGYEEKLLVSSDYVNDPRSSIIDADSTMVIDNKHVKIFSWYDNEWGYVNRLADLTQMIGKSIC